MFVNCETIVAHNFPNSQVLLRGDVLIHLWISRSFLTPYKIPNLDNRCLHISVRCTLPNVKQRRFRRPFLRSSPFRNGRINLFLSFLFCFTAQSRSQGACVCSPALPRIQLKPLLRWFPCFHINLIEHNIRMKR